MTLELMRERMVWRVPTRRRLTHVTRLSEETKSIPMEAATVGKMTAKAKIIVSTIAD